MKHVPAALAERTPWQPYHVCLGFTGVTEHFASSLDPVEMAQCASELLANGCSIDMRRKLLVATRIATKAIANMMMAADERS
jgi:hypothetical protein